jgi:ribonucleotide reductase alpha subunit
MKFARRFTSDLHTPIHAAPRQHVASLIKWKVIDAEIFDERTHSVIFRQKNVTVPAHWSDRATSILAQKYFRKAGVPKRTKNIANMAVPSWLLPRQPEEGTEFGGETSAVQTIHRIVGCWTYWGWLGSYFDTEEDAQVFYDESFYALAMQMMSPNSPQWFNTGLHWAYGITGENDTGQWYVPDTVRSQQGLPTAVRTRNAYERPQPHACFLTGTEDHLVADHGIMDTWKLEARIFKYGSGSGVNVSPWRAKGEKLSGGGVASGVMSWLRIGDSAAGAIQSGGTTRRAAKMIQIDDDHPEVPELIKWKEREEHKAASLYVGSEIIRLHAEGKLPEELHHLVPKQINDRIANGFPAEVYEIAYEAEAIRTVDGQNSNNSIRISDALLEASSRGDDWCFYSRTEPRRNVREVKASTIIDDIARAAWASADPGVIFNDTVNAWNTCAADGCIKTTNPCFTGDTKVWTIDGPRRFDELAVTGDPIQVLTELEDGHLAYRLMTSPRMTKRDAKVLEITLKAQRGPRGNNTTKLRVTPDHVFFLRNGKKCRADRLGPGDRIESAYRSFINDKDWLVRSTSGDQVIESYLIVETRDGRRPVYPDEHIHHKNGNHSDNTLDNLEIKPASDHNSEHMRGDFNPMRRWYKSLPAEEQEAHRAKYSRPGLLNPNYGNKGHLADRVWINNGKNCRRIKQDEQIPDGWTLGYLRLNNYQSEETRHKRGEAIHAAAVRRRSNHRVVSVVELSGAEDVYCGTVSDTGRFFVSLGDDDSRTEGVLVSNCAEFHFLDWAACNLASSKLTAFLDEDGTFDHETFAYICRLLTIILDISVSMASFPAPEFAVSAYNYRTLGIGYSDLGGLLMRMGIPYDSSDGRALAALITALMTGTAYQTSAEMAEDLGPFPRWPENEKDFMRVMRNHRRALWPGQIRNWENMNIEPYCEIQATGAPKYRELMEAAISAWNTVCNESTSFRNAQVSLIAPTGTISFAMDCDTTGMEPEFSLLKVKHLAGGGTIKTVSTAVRPVLKRLGYDDVWIDTAIKALEEGRKWPVVGKGITDIKELACSHEISPEGHLFMLAAIQPLVSGAASKTINLPEDATIEQVRGIFLLAHKMGIKSVAVYRDNCKLAQPMERGDKKAEIVEPTVKRLIPRHLDKLVTVTPELASDSFLEKSLGRGERELLPWCRDKGYTQKARIGDQGREQTLFWRVSEFPDGRPGELFIVLAKQGSAQRAVAECFAISVSIGLQRGVPLEAYTNQFMGVSFEPAGYVQGTEEISFAPSFIDLVFRDLAIRYLGRDDLRKTVPAAVIETLGDPERIVALDRTGVLIAGGARQTGRYCPSCGAGVVQTGRCYQCPNCSWNEGCSG